MIKNYGCNRNRNLNRNRKDALNKFLFIVKPILDDDEMDDKFN